MSTRRGNSVAIEINRLMNATVHTPVLEMLGFTLNDDFAGIEMKRVRVQYRRQAAQVHPDQGGRGHAQAGEAMARLTRAYEIAAAYAWYNGDQGDNASNVFPDCLFSELLTYEEETWQMDFERETQQSFEVEAEKQEEYDQMVPRARVCVPLCRRARAPPRASVCVPSRARIFALICAGEPLTRAPRAPRAPHTRAPRAPGSGEF